MTSKNLLSRLRHLADYAADTDELSDAIYEAVAEIKRLQAERDEWKRGSETVNARLLAEVDRFEASLVDAINANAEARATMRIVAEDLRQASTLHFMPNDPDSMNSALDKLCDGVDDAIAELDPDGVPPETKGNAT